MNAHNVGQYLLLPPAWLAALLAGLFALLAWRMRWLTSGGALSTFVVGCILYWLGGGKAIVPLLVFFLTSSLLSKIAKAQHKGDDPHSEKGATRDQWQVWANGGVAVGLVVLHRFLVWRGYPLFKVEGLPILFLAALAAVNADTWATEIGRLSRQTPRSLRDWKPVTAGTSGAVSPVGTLAALAGAIVIPLCVVFWWPLNPAQFVCAAWGGFLGSLVDSLLGASLQAQYRDTVSGELTERWEIDGRATKPVRGLRWMNNDCVNLMASAAGVLCAWFLLRFSHLM